MKSGRNRGVSPSEYLICEILKEKRECLIAAVAKTDNWPVNKEMLIKKHYKAFVKFTKQLDKIKEMNTHCGRGHLNCLNARSRGLNNLN